jgi:hypothetical protein
MNQVDPCESNVLAEDGRADAARYGSNLCAADMDAIAAAHGFI